MSIYGSRDRFEPVDPDICEWCGGEIDAEPKGYHDDAPVLVPRSNPIDQLLTKMQLKVYQMAIVGDEFCTVVGLTTLADIIEIIVSEMFDSENVKPIPSALRIQRSSMVGQSSIT